MKIFSVFLLLSTLVFGEQYSEGLSADFVFKADLNRRLSHFIPYRTDENPIALLTIDVVDQSTYIYVRRALKEFRKKRVSFVLVEISAHGGEFFSALKHSKAARGDGSRARYYCDRFHPFGSFRSYLNKCCADSAR